jgi:hypothetical protein
MFSRLGNVVHVVRSAPRTRSLLSIQSTTTNTTTTTTSINRFIQPRRNASSSKKGTPPPPKKNTDKPPEINFDHRQGNTILHQKAARAAELHAELNTLLETQAQRRADEANRHFGAGFLDFVKSSKSELINIFAAFTCVLLAWQIAAIRKGARKLIDSAEEKNEKMEEYKLVLRILSSNAFLERVSEMHRDELKERARNQGGRTASIGGWFGQSKRNDGEESSTSTSTQGDERSNDILAEILKRELVKVIGDKALTSAEIEEKKLLQLQKEMGLVQQAQKEIDSLPKRTDDSLGGLEQIFIEMQNEDDSGRKVVKRSKGFI